jgi:hypothetical protein
MKLKTIACATLAIALLVVIGYFFGPRLYASANAYRRQFLLDRQTGEMLRCINAGDAAATGIGAHENLNGQLYVYVFYIVADSDGLLAANQQVVNCALKDPHWSWIYIVDHDFKQVTTVDDPEPHWIGMLWRAVRFQRSVADQLVHFQTGDQFDEYAAIVQAGGGMDFTVASDNTAADTTYFNDR